MAQQMRSIRHGKRHGRARTGKQTLAPTGRALLLSATHRVAEAIVPGLSKRAEAEALHAKYPHASKEAIAFFVAAWGNSAYRAAIRDLADK